MNTVRILVGSALDVLKKLPEASVHTCITSPPYFGLRDYKTEPLVWGGNTNCKHVWQERRYYTEQSSGKKSGEAGKSNAARLKEGRWRTDSWCGVCGAWLGNLGLE